MRLLVKSCFFFLLALAGMCHGNDYADYDIDPEWEAFIQELDKALEENMQYQQNVNDQTSSTTEIPETYTEESSTVTEIPETYTEESSTVTEIPETYTEESSTVTETPETYTEESTTEVQENVFNYEWSDQAGRWLKYHATPAYWEAARMTCHSEGAILASPLTYKLRADLESFVLKQDAVKDNEENNVTIFTGVHAIFSSGDYASIEGVPLARLAMLWASGEPNNLGNSERCLAMTIRNFGLDADTSCDRQLPYVCYKRDPAKEYRFDYEWSEKAEGWLKYHMMPVTWDEAKPRCEAEGAVLASPLDSQLEEAIVTFVQNHDDFNEGVTIFTGSPKTYVTLETKTERINSDDLEYWDMYDYNRGYYYEYSGDKKEERCMAMKVDHDGTSFETRCDTVLPYVCYKKKKELTVTECGTTDSEYVFEPRTGSCYKFHNKNATWSEAYMTCMAEGGYLTVINNDLEAQVIREMFAKYPTYITAGFNYNMLNVGINDWGHHGALFMTIHGESLEGNFHGWYRGQPNHNSIPYLGLYEESCGSVDRDVTLHDNFCNAGSVFLCEMKPKSLLDGYEV